MAARLLQQVNLFFSLTHIAPLIFQMAQNLNLSMCFGPSTLSQHLGCWGQNTSRIQNKGVYPHIVFAGQQQLYTVHGMHNGQQIQCGMHNGCEGASV